MGGGEVALEGRGVKKGREINLTSKTLQPKAALPRGGGVKRTLYSVKQQVGFEHATSRYTVKCFNC